MLLERLGEHSIVFVLRWQQILVCGPEPDSERRGKTKASSEVGGNDAIEFSAPSFGSSSTPITPRPLGVMIKLIPRPFAGKRMPRASVLCPVIRCLDT